jgi:hypothetical protein
MSLPLLSAVFSSSLFLLRLSHVLQHLPRRQSSKSTHNLYILLLNHLVIILTNFCQNPEIINIKRRRKRIEKFRFLLKRIAECMRGTDWDCHVVSSFGIYDGVVGGVEADCALGYEEGLVVHFVPVRGRARGTGWNGEFGAAYAVVLWRSVGNVDNRLKRGEVPVLDPSSIILQVM